MAKTPPRTQQDISEIMGKVHSQGTAPELKFSAALKDRGIVDLEANRADLAGKPDFVIASRQIAIFIDGDFWHGGQWRRRGKTALEEQFTRTEAKSKTYWLNKIRRNMQRDSANTAALLA